MAEATATLGGGCFWCIEAVFTELRGVLGVVPGYAGGHVPNPTYAQVCGEDTGHIEVARIAFDPGVIGYRDLLDVFFTMHDPTSWDRQGADVGQQYRSVVFYHSEEQRLAAESAIADLTATGVFDRPIVTEVRPLDTFYPAEAYHHGYYAANPDQPYCRVVIAPKVARLRQQHLARLRPA
jgi:peptide-methionine (S)-S-oxide reductase